MNSYPSDSGNARDAADVLRHGTICPHCGQIRPHRPDPLGVSRLAGWSAVLGLLALLLGGLTGLPAVVLGVLGLREIRRSEGGLAGSGRAVFGLFAGGVGLAAAIGIAPFLFLHYNEKRSEENLKQLALAFHAHNDSTGAFPSAAICDDDGKPLLSWRVAVLPYIGEKTLYQKFKLDEPWNGPTNI